MAGKTSRNKGAVGEREFLKILSQYLGTDLTRNLSQSRSGGADCVTLPGYAIEIKRQEEEKLTAWWRQTIKQAEEGECPVLAYRRNGQKWRVVLPLHYLLPAIEPSDQLVHTVTMSIDAFAKVIKES